MTKVKHRKKIMTRVGFESTPFRTRALIWRLRPTRPSDLSWCFSSEILLDRERETGSGAWALGHCLCTWRGHETKGECMAQLKSAASPTTPDSVNSQPNYTRFRKQPAQLPREVSLLYPFAYNCSHILLVSANKFISHAEKANKFVYTQLQLAK